MCELSKDCRACIVHPRCPTIRPEGVPIAIFGWVNIGPEISIAAELLEFQRHYGGEIKVSSIKDKLVFDRVALITSEREFWEELLRLEETIGTRFGYSAMRIPFNASGTQRPVHH